MPSYKLSYFDLRGSAEVSRQMLHLSGTPFEDHRVTMEDWPAHKDFTPFGKLPVLYVDGKPLPQSFAIARYLANQFGYAGKSAFESAWVDALGDQYKDYQAELSPFLMVAYGFREGDKAQLLREVAEPAIQKFYRILEKRAQDNGSNGHFVGDSLTWIDLVVSDHVGILDTHVPGFLTAFPLVEEIRKKTTSCPKLKGWIDKRPVTSF